MLHRSIPNLPRLLGMTGVLALLFAPAGFATSITNGNFDAVIISSNGSVNPLDVPGWTQTGSVGDGFLWNINLPVCCGGPMPASLPGGGDQFVTMGGGFGAAGSAAWSHTITGLTTGQSYVVTFDTASEGETATQQVTAGITAGSSTPAETFTTVASPVLFWQNWGQDQYTFLATGTAATLQFSVTNQQYDVGLTDVSIAPAATTVPEPTSLLLFGTGLLTCLGAVRKRLQ